MANVNFPRVSSYSNIMSSKKKSPPKMNMERSPPANALDSLRKRRSSNSRLVMREPSEKEKLSEIEEVNPLTTPIKEQIITP